MIDIHQKVRQIRALLETSKRPAPLILDLMRLKKADYIAECRGFNFQLNARSFEWFTILENVVWEEYFSSDIHLPRGGTVIDIGANFGSFSVVASRKVGPEGHVMAFEPNPHVFDRLMSNMRLNKLDNIQAFNQAVSDKDGEMQLLVHQRSAFSTLVGRIDGRDDENAEAIRIQTRALDSIMDALDRPIDLLKIDCEGSEYDILNSLTPRSASRIKQIAMEVHRIDGHQPGEINDRLQVLGYRVKDEFPKLTAFRV